MTPAFRRSKKVEPTPAAPDAAGAVASRRAFLKAAAVGAAGAAAGGVAGAAIGAGVYAQESSLDFAPETPEAEPGFEHLVVVMYENRSFDNLLGWLYTSEELKNGQSFEGLHQGDHSNPVPGTDEVIKAHAYTGSTDEIMGSPNPDPGEEYSHVNTQLFQKVDPESNSDLHANGLQYPYNAPGPNESPTMKGFVEDYIINYKRITKNKKEPSRKEYELAMGGFTPDMLPVFSTLAKNFAVYDHWFSAVPSQTFCNRVFFHASTSHGYVTNKGDGGYDKWLDAANDAPTIFNRLEEAGLSWRVYYDAAQLVSMTGVLHAPVLEPYWKTNFRVMEQFYDDVANGDLPDYCFIEPRMIYNHNDMHPPHGTLRESDDVTDDGDVVIDGAVSDARAGDALLHAIYSAVRSSDSPTGSNAMNTMLLVTFDEHGGTYDHVPPPSATPPRTGEAGEMDFTFDRFGCRVPAIAISAYTAKNTIITEQMDHGSVISTLTKLHGLKPLTHRDVNSRDMFNAVNLKKPRPASDWPQTLPQYTPPNPEVSFDATSQAQRAKPISNPAKGLLGLVIAKYGVKGEPEPDTYGEAYAALMETQNVNGQLFGTLDSIDGTPTPKATPDPSHSPTPGA
ncbi:alkaline phosphatase family protein [Herbiconiux sp. YIM B11900]|uniref:alkaline phosphatase family protein n=1 Tax=Herbiconiux sp. YIM B11900 TaxID=3404131 RepID=UPI003F87FFF4